MVVEEGLALPILLGNKNEILSKVFDLGLSGIKDIEIIDPAKSANDTEFAEFLFESRKRKGISQSEAQRLVATNYYYASIAVALGKADGLVAGASSNYADCVRPILQAIGVGKSGLAAGLNVVLFKGKIILFADTSINKCPTSEDLANIAIHASKAAEYFGLVPQIAMLSYSNFTGEDGVPLKMQKATELVKLMKPNLIVDGDMQADTAIDPDIVKRIFPFCEIKNGANILVFPNLESGNISYKLLQQLGGGEVLGPFIMGLKRPANVVARASTTEDIFNTIAMTALQIQAVESY
jgi:malate dehydrogenase (oxaloacetate-decarboxylating)(NADP+)